MVWLYRYVTGLRCTAPFGAWAAVAASLVFWNASFLGWSWWAIPVGLGGGLAVLLPGGLLASQAAASSANRRRFVSLQDRLQSLEAPVKAAGGEAEADLLDAKAQLALRGPQWLTGVGYIDVSRTLHQIAAELLEQASMRILLEVAQTDKLRLTGSDIPAANRDALLQVLDGPLSQLQSAAAVDPDKPAGPVVASAVTEVRQALDEYRDSIMEGIARLRSHILDASAIAGSLVYLLLVDVKAYDSLKPLGSGIAFYLVGALVGLLSALQALSQMSTEGDDFGLTAARLVTNPILSGLSGVAGALVVSLLGAAGVQPTGLAQIFDVVNHPIGLVVAAAFGVAPAVLLNGLSALAQRYSSGLGSTQPASTAHGPNSL